MLLPDILDLVHEFAGRPAYPTNLLHFRILSGFDGFRADGCCWVGCAYVDRYFRILARLRPQASVKTLHNRLMLEIDLNTIFAYCHDAFDPSSVDGYLVDKDPRDPVPRRMLTYSEVVLEGVYDFNNDVIGDQYD
jgi:hypothetical protein